MSVSKVPMIAWETSLFNGCTHTEREICNRVSGGKKLIKRFKLLQKVKKKPQKVLIGTSFEGDDEKAYIVC